MSPTTTPSQWKDRTAIITGGAHGIGFAVAQRLNSPGVRVALLDMNSGKLDKASEALGNAEMLGYSTSKAAMIGMTKVQGKEYAGTGITLNAIAPTVIVTELLTAMPEEQIKYMTEKIPMKRWGTKDEVAAMVEFIVSPEASFTTGFTFDLTGGRATC